MEKQKNHINEIQKKIYDIEEIFEDFSDATAWNFAREENKLNKIDEVWKKRKLYIHLTLQQLHDEKNRLRDEKNRLRDEKNLLLKRLIQLNEAKSIENGFNISIM